jgi:ATP-binding cassette, subfamily D (ALD), peroxisomal long-chain fatty acid import protein
VFDKAPIVTPSGDIVLVRDLTLKIQPGDHLMITGANGSGKTSILRVLAGLWPLFRGRLSRPDPGVANVFAVPQRPYLVQGTLRDQIIYPHAYAQMAASGRTDDELMEALKMVYLEYVVAREGGLDTVKEWKDVFSGENW